MNSTVIKRNTLLNELNFLRNFLTECNKFEEKYKVPNKAISKI